MRILTGDEIGDLARTNRLIISENFRPEACEGFYYNLTLGEQYVSISNNDRTYRQIDGTLTIGPSESVSVEIWERLHFVDSENVARYGGLVVASPRLLAGGLAHVTTLIDAGFSRPTTLTLTNLRNHPSQELRPRQDAIAKLLVICFEDDDQLPEPWRPTRSYAAADRGKLPPVWGGAAPRWHPRAFQSTEELRTLASESGPPFDLLAAGLIEALDIRHDSSRRVAEHETKLGAVSTQLDGVIHRLDKHIDQQNAADDSRTQNRKLLWGTVAATIIAAIVGAIVGSLVTASIQHGGSPSNPTTTTSTTVRVSSIRRSSHLLWPVELDEGVWLRQR